MNAGPRDPGRETAQAQFARLEDPEVLPDHRHVALVEVAEGGSRLPPGEPARDELAHVGSLLHRDLGHPGQRLAILLEVSGVPAHEPPGPPRYAQARPDGHAPAPIRLGAKPLPRR